MITKESFGKTKDGKEVHSYKLTNKNGVSAIFINYGATMISLEVPDNSGKSKDVVLGYETPRDYEEDKNYFGCIVGRYANRITKGQFEIDGVKYQLNCNEGKNHLHGGNEGFNKKLWEAETFEDDNEIGIKFKYTSPDGEENYPGKLDCVVTYTLTSGDELMIDYEAETDRPTIVNLTNHSYFNLNGHDSGDILDNLLTIHGENITAIGPDLIPTGIISATIDTPLDFSTPHVIGERIDQLNNGYDHNYVINKSEKEISPAAKVYAPETGIEMEVMTDQPGIQFYSGNFLDNVKGKGGAVYNKHCALCLETQLYPDSPSHVKFPDAILRPGEKYSHRTVYKFRIVEKEE